MNDSNNKLRSPKNKTTTLSPTEIELYRQNLVKLANIATATQLENRIINQDLFEVINFLPERFVDLLFIDPPYNLTKNFNTNLFKERSTREYIEWFEQWFPKLLKTLKPNASVYICGDWKSITAIHLIAEKSLKVRSRITWEREKGRGAKANWKNCSEDILFCTLSNQYTFNIEAVKMRRKVVAPYKVAGKPKDWVETTEGNYRLTYPSNIWTDLTIPYWSMSENTDHPTQKPEKLLAKILLASSNPNDLILDPFIGSGTTAVVAKKLARKYVGIEVDSTYCCLAEKRLALAEKRRTIQGYTDGVFWERNSFSEQRDLYKNDEEILRARLLESPTLISKN